MSYIGFVINESLIVRCSYKSLLVLYELMCEFLFPTGGEFKLEIALGFYVNWIISPVMN